MFCLYLDMRLSSQPTFFIYLMIYFYFVIQEFFLYIPFLVSPDPLMKRRKVELSLDGSYNVFRYRIPEPVPDFLVPSSHYLILKEKSSLCQQLKFK